MAEEKDIDKAVTALKANVTKYAKTTRYYNGDHDLAFATDKFKNAFGSLFREFALNICPAVVDALRDKLIITGFSVEKGESDVSDDAWKIWQMNRMGKRAGEIHKEAIRNGDAYAIVWVDANKRLTIYPNKAESCTVFYDEETPGKVMWAAKYWRTVDKKFRLNLFYPDRIEKYISKSKAPSATAVNTTWSSGIAYDQNFNVQKTDSTGSLLPEAKSFIPFGDDGSEIMANPYGTVPVFHFANNTDIGSFGFSELKAAMPVQDGLNKSVLDMLVAMEFASYRQRWASGIEIDYDDNGKPIPPFMAGIERLWVTEHPEAKFGDFEAANLEQFLKIKDGFRTDIATVTGTPLHYFMLTGAAFPQSGISIEKLESRFLGKVRDRMESFGQVWEDLMTFALTIENKGKDTRLFTEWEDPAPLSEKEKLDNLIAKQTLGITDEQLWTEAGYGLEDIKKMTEAKAQAQEAMVKSFNAGQDPAGGKII